MSNKLLATTSCTFKATPQGTWTPNMNIISPVFIPSIKIFVENKPLALQQITWTIIGCTLSGYTHSGGASVAPMLPTANKLQIESQGILRKEDFQMCSGIFIQNGTGTQLPCSCKIEIDNPGQTKIMGK